MARKEKVTEEDGFKPYTFWSFIWGVIFLTGVNLLIAVVMEPVFGLFAVTGVFFLVEHMFILHLITDRNYRNVIYLKQEIDKLKNKRHNQKQTKNNGNDSNRTEGCEREDRRESIEHQEKQGGNVLQRKTDDV